MRNERGNCEAGQIRRSSFPCIWCRSGLRPHEDELDFIPKRNLPSIKALIEETLLSDRIPVVDVTIIEEVDWEGDEVLRIDMIFEGSIKKLHGEKLSRALQHVRSKLNEVHESAIPLVSFISKADLRRSKRVSA